MAFGQRSYIASHFALVLDNQPLFLKKVEGGDLKADVISEAMGADNITYKHIGTPKYGELTFTIGMSISKPLHDWIKASWDKAYFRKGGEVVACDFDYKPITARTFQEGLITSTQFPACDAKGKEPAYLTVKVKPEIIRWNKGGSGVKISGKPAGQKTWVPQNFALEIKGYEDDLKRVSKIDALEVKQSAVEDAHGASRDSAFEPGKLEYPDLSFTLPENNADKLHDFFYDFIILGHCTEDKELDGSLHFTSKASQPNAIDSLMTLNFFHLGPNEMSPEAMEAGSESIKNVKFKFYNEKVSLDPGKLAQGY